MVEYQNGECHSPNENEKRINTIAISWNNSTQID